MARSGFDAPSNAPVREPSADAASAGGRPATASALGNRRSILLQVALVSVVSSSLFLHETGNRLLAEGTLLGFAVNARAVSCLANITGITAGFAVSTRCAASFSSLRRNRWFWVGFFAVQELLTAAFCLTLSPQGPCLGTVATQFASGASVAVFLTACMGFARYCSFARFRTLMACAVVLTVAITYGLLSALAVRTPLLASLGVQALIMAVGGICFLSAIRPDKPNASGERNGRTRKGYLAADQEQESERPFATSADSRPLSYFAIILASCGLVFGFLHVIPLGLPVFQLPRVLPNLIGAAVAMALFVITVPRSEPSTVLVWNRIYRISFPFVVLAALLVPYTSADEYVSSLSFVESAQFFFVALLIIGCFVVCRTTGVGYTQVFSYAMLVYNAGFLGGNIVGAVVHDTVPLNDWTFGLMGIAIFLLLTVVTFNTNGEKYAKTAWGILPKETPKALYARNRERRCNELADEHGLTARERETLLLLAEGKRPKQISEIRTVSIATVRTHVQGVYSKLGVHSADELDRLVRSGE